jgi:hypothetical protein
MWTKTFGKKYTIKKKKVKKHTNPKISLTTKYGWKGTLSNLESTPKGLVDPSSCNKAR